MKRNNMAGAAAGLGILMAAANMFPAFADTVYVNADVLNFRNRPSLEADAVLGTMKRGTELIRMKNDGEWSEVRFTDSKYSVYVASRYLTTEDAGAQKAAESPYVDKTWDVGLDSNAPYASFSMINSGKAVYYQNKSADRKGKTICVNAGHGTKGGGSVKTYCHPDKTAKVTGGTTAAGATTAAAVSGGMTFADGTPESKVTLQMAKVLRDRLLAEGYDVLMLREEDDVQLDNIARTVIANKNADCHIALHWDSTEKNKGAFFMSVPSNKTYRAMEPVASNWESHNRLGTCLVDGLKKKGTKIFSTGSMEMDLTQTSFSTIPSVDIELGDKTSGHSAADLEKLADGLVLGVNTFFGY